jgi:hypothetical protein
MTEQQIEKYKKAADEGSIPDNENPLFLFSLASSKLLCLGIKGEISFTEIARHTLANRGQDLKGEWVGFGKARELLFPKKKKVNRIKGKL